MELSYVLQSPVVTEKTTKGQTQQKYSFLVHADANKAEVTRAIEEIYGVTVTKVNMVKVLEKSRIGGKKGRRITKRHAAKKAIVTIEKKQTIDFNKFTKKSK